ncbi:Uma2 family endonuclease [Nodosilinea sp. LEGE 07298]|uniref:Uma2 family endonuclease n=1 Tax=Nodosilinea sp. LEGE 07298 TaxID=2777970 RepID=UPI00188270AC|nr:Uma2 family endonuclease [Nodosilinea sp. LEGE 07298]MBE9110122.1 Uma2 family endonuclease [Nodosilinea sp. LEGE 07298]
MTPHVAIAKWTLDDYHQMIAAGILSDRRVELLNGEIIEMPPEGEPHAYYASTVGDYLRAMLGEQAQIRESHPITIPAAQSETEPDLAVVQPLGKEYLQHHPYPENVFWLMEFSDTSLQKDLEPKAKTYAAAGIPEYWVVNLQRMELVVMRNPVNEVYQSQTTLKEGSITPIAFPDVPISVRRLLD